jgi:hypothetical protein
MSAAKSSAGQSPSELARYLRFSAYFFATFCA